VESQLIVKILSPLEKEGNLHMREDAHSTHTITFYDFNLLLFYLPIINRRNYKAGKFKVCPCGNITKVWWKVIYKFCCKFVPLSNGEKVCKRLRFDDVITMSLVAPFLEHGVYIILHSRLKLKPHLFDLLTNPQQIEQVEFELNPSRNRRTIRHRNCLLKWWEVPFHP